MYAQHHKANDVKLHQPQLMLWQVLACIAGIQGVHAWLQALQQREQSVRNGKLTTIIFIRDKNAKGQEVSGYIDYGHRCDTAACAVGLICSSPARNVESNAPFNTLKARLLRVQVAVPHSVHL